MENLEDLTENLEEIALGLDVVALDDPLEVVQSETETETIEDLEDAQSETLDLDEYALAIELATEEDQGCVLFLFVTLSPPLELYLVLELYSTIHNLSYSLSLSLKTYRWPTRFNMLTTALIDKSAVKSEGGPDVIMGPSKEDMCLVVPAPIQDAPFNIFNDQLAFLAGGGKAFVANGMEIYAMSSDTSGTFCMFRDGDMTHITLMEARRAHPMVSFQ